MALERPSRDFSPRGIISLVDSTKRSRGDWQTPHGLALALSKLAARTFQPKTILEPTCGQGSFLKAATSVWPDVHLIGIDIHEDHLHEASKQVPHAHLIHQDIFQVCFDDLLKNVPRPILVLGNPPWVTASTLGLLGSKTSAPKSSKGLRGLEALTGSSNFDIAEVLLDLLLAQLPEDTLYAVLCKSKVFRRILARHPIEASIFDVDAKKHFQASVDAAFLIANSQPASRWPRFASLDDLSPYQTWGILEGYGIVPHIDTCAPPSSKGFTWRSGVKHDAKAVLVFDSKPLLEDLYVFPFLSGSEISKGISTPTKYMIVPQMKLGDSTDRIEQRAPKTWAYLQAHKAVFERRKSKVYAHQPPFAVFGVGPHTFRPWKVAIAGMSKKVRFTLLEPTEGKPIVLDDTTYFLSFDTEDEARRVHDHLVTLTEDLQSRIFLEDKRPITSRVLATLNLPPCNKQEEGM